MHRQRTKFSQRVNRVFTHRADRVAKAIERQGIRATYELHDRLLSNRASRERFGEAPPELDDVQESILADVREQGYALRSFQDLVPDAEHWRAIEEQRDRFVASTEASVVYRLEDVNARANTLQAYNHYLGDPGKLTWDLDRYRKTTPDKIRATAAKYIVPANAVTIITNPTGGAK